MDAPEKVFKAKFKEKMENSPDFISWLLSKTKFAGVNATPILVRCDNPWYQSRRTGRQSETDILIVFETPDRNVRFALHIEYKRASEKFQPDQPELYHERARDWLNLPKWKSHTDFEVLLIAPKEFYERNKSQSDIFHRYISLEEIANFL